MIGGNKALIEKGINFYYGLYYSNILTWGGEAPPRDGDSIYVPKETTLIID